jgi:hypothetical protein
MLEKCLSLLIHRFRRSGFALRATTRQVYTDYNEVAKSVEVVHLGKIILGVYSCSARLFHGTELGQFSFIKTPPFCQRASHIGHDHLVVLIVAGLFELYDACLGTGL